MSNDVLTTTQVARLLGVSVRTAQIFVESGAIPSWKTPGGHRRVHHADVVAFMERTTRTPAVPSARVVLIASGERRAVLERSLSEASGCFTEVYDSALAAAIAIGSRMPAAVIVDLEEETDERVALLSRLTADSVALRARLVVLSATRAAAALRDGALPPQVHSVDPVHLADVVRALLSDRTEGEEPFENPSAYPRAANERHRLAALGRANLVDTPPEDAFDRITWLAGYTLDAPVALMTVLTSTRQWFKSRQGLTLVETPRSWAFCNHTILQRDAFVVPDLSADERFVQNPAVVGSPHFRFYAGAPVMSPDGFALASLCVIDYAPRAFDDGDTRALLSLAALASDELRLRAASPTTVV